MVEDEHPQVGRLRELLLDPRVPVAADVPVVEVGLGRVDGDDGNPVDVDDGVPRAEQLLEVYVADVPRVVVPGDDDERLAGDPVEVGLGLGILRLEALCGQVARANDDRRLELVDLHDRPLHEVRDEVRRPAMKVGDMCDAKHEPPLAPYTNPLQSVMLGRPNTLVTSTADGRGNSRFAGKFSGR
jgi:hypothetical protein